MEELLSVRLAPEWITDCLWVVRVGDDIRQNCAPESLSADVPATLVAEIRAWDDEFQAVFTSDDPMSSGFPDERTTRNWHVRGDRLAQRLATALGVPVEHRNHVFTP